MTGKLKTRITTSAQTMESSATQLAAAHAAAMQLVPEGVRSRMLILCPCVSSGTAHAIPAQTKRSAIIRKAV
jgi:hypothetical protein